MTSQVLGLGLGLMGHGLGLGLVGHVLDSITGPKLLVMYSKSTRSRSFC